LTIIHEIFPQLFGHNNNYFTGITGFVFNKLESLMGIDLVQVYDDKDMLFNTLQQSSVDIVTEVIQHDKKLISPNYFSQFLSFFLTDTMITLNYRI
jgi:hypothetical protein